jgi:hypothetical protein
MIEFWKLRAELRMLGSFDPLEMAMTRKNTIVFGIPGDRVHVISNTKVWVLCFRTFRLRISTAQNLS